MNHFIKRRSQHAQSGIALIAAIFLIVIIASALVILATLSVRNTEQTTQNLLKTRAQMAASAAGEFAVQSLIENSGSNCATLNGSVVSIPEYSNFNVSLSCSENDYNRPSQQITLFNLITVAEYGTVGDPDYVWTELEMTVEF